MRQGSPTANAAMGGPHGEGEQVSGPSSDRLRDGWIVRRRLSRPARRMPRCSLACDAASARIGPHRDHLSGGYPADQTVWRPARLTQTLGGIVLAVRLPHTGRERMPTRHDEEGEPGADQTAAKDPDPRT